MVSVCRYVVIPKQPRLAMKSNKKVRVGLLSKGIIGISLLLMTTFGAVGYYQVKVARETIVSVQVDHARTLAAVLANVLETHGSLGGPDSLRMTKTFSSHEGDSAILVLDRSGRVAQNVGQRPFATSYKGQDARYTLRTGRSTWDFEDHVGANGSEQRLDITWPIHEHGKVVGAVEVSISGAKLRSALRRVVIRIAIVDFLGLAALFLGLVMLTSKWVLHPLSMITQGTERAAAGDLDQMLTITSGDEFEELSRSFNRMSRALKAKHAELETLATTDPLTGLANRRRFYEFIDEEVARNQRYGGFFAICSVDIDFFKNYNDEFGHMAGDAALKEIADILQNNVRDSDLAARVGGEEFSLVLAAQGREEAQAVVMRLLQAVRTHKFSLTPGVKLTVSAGVAVYPEDSDSAELVIKKSDDALYQAKNEGRDRAVISLAGRLA